MAPESTETGFLLWHEAQIVALLRQGSVWHVPNEDLGITKRQCHHYCVMATVVEPGREIVGVYVVSTHPRFSGFWIYPGEAECLGRTCCIELVEARPLLLRKFMAGKYSWECDLPESLWQEVQSYAEAKFD